MVFVFLVMLIKQQPEYFPQTSGTPPVADLRGRGGALPARAPSPYGPKFMQFFGKFAKIIGLRPLLRRILDPPLLHNQRLSPL